MPILIIVSGVTNSGKTSSIRNFANRYVGHSVGGAGGDFTHHGSFSKGLNSYYIGIASAGDSDTLVQQAITFFQNNNCDLMICATKSHGETVDRIDNHVTTHPGLVVHRIMTLPTPHSNGITGRHTMTADTIWQLIP